MKTPFKVLLPVVLLLILPAAVHAQFTLKYYTNGNTVTLWGYTGTPVSLAIPEFVTSIQGEAFSYCTSLTSVTVPDNVTDLGGAAFSDCTSLTNVTIGRGVTSIDVYTFYECASLTSVMIPATVTNIEYNAFYGCTSLTSVTIPRNVTSLGATAFGNCYLLTAVYFQGGAPSVDSSAFNSDTNATVYYLPGTTGWEHWVSPPPAVLWNPQPQNVAVQANQIGFTIVGTPDIPIAVAACTNPASPAWSPLQTCTLTNGSIYFTDPDWTNHPTRFYRIRSP
jgi:hypothetical protein